MVAPTELEPQEWESIVTLPQCIGVAIMQTQESGPLQFLKELMALTTSVMDSILSDNQLIHAVAAFHRAHPEGFHAERIVTAEEALDFRLGVLDDCRSVSELLAKLAPGITEEEAAGYREWCVQIGRKVAESAREGSFLGLGGTQVTVEEEETLAEVAEALGLDHPM